MTAMVHWIGPRAIQAGVADLKFVRLLLREPLTVEQERAIDRRSVSHADLALLTLPLLAAMNVGDRIFVIATNLG